MYVCVRFDPIFLSVVSSFAQIIAGSDGLINEPRPLAPASSACSSVSTVNPIAASAASAALIPSASTSPSTSASSSADDLATEPGVLGPSIVWPFLFVFLYLLNFFVLGNRAVSRSFVPASVSHLVSMLIPMRVPHLPLGFVSEC